MKKYLIIIMLLITANLLRGKTFAQQVGLAPDQNPRYKESQNKYIPMADSLNRQQGTTVQNTYKAYDWYTARQERRQQNREWRHQERMYGGYYNYSPGWSVYSGYSSPYYSSYGNYGYGYGNRWGGWGGRGNFGFGYGW